MILWIPSSSTEFLLAMDDLFHPKVRMGLGNSLLPRQLYTKTTSAMLWCLVIKWHITHCTFKLANNKTHPAGSRGRVVKAMDLKSIGVSPRRFESCRLRFYPHKEGYRRLSRQWHNQLKPLCSHSSQVQQPANSREYSVWNIDINLKCSTKSTYCVKIILILIWGRWLTFPYLLAMSTWVLSIKLRFHPFLGWRCFHSCYLF